MAQAFITTYQTNYRWNVQERVKACKGVDPHGIVLPMDESWITEHVPVDQKDVEDEKQAIEEKLKKKRQDLLRSIYQIDYTHPDRTHVNGDVPKEAAPEFNCEESGVEEDTEDELINYGRKLYEPKLPLQKVPTPLVGTRKIFGYLRPSHCYTPMTVYQKHIGKVGYDVLKDKYLQAKNKFCGGDAQAAEIAAGSAKDPAGKQPKVEKERKNKCETCCVCCPCYRGKL